MERAAAEFLEAVRRIQSAAGIQSGVFFAREDDGAEPRELKLEPRDWRSGDAQRLVRRVVSEGWLLFGSDGRRWVRLHDLEHLIRAGMRETVDGAAPSHSG